MTNRALVAIAGLITLGAPALALAIGLCEQTEDSYAVKSWSAKLSQLAVERVFEVCEEDEDMNENRQTFTYLAILGTDGDPVRAFVKGDKAELAAFKKTLGDGMANDHVKPWADSAAWLKANGFTPLKAGKKSPNKACRVVTKREGNGRDEGEISVSVTVRNGKKVIFDKTFEGRGSNRYKAQVYFLPGARAMAFHTQMPDLHGPSAPDGSFGPDLIEVEALEIVTDKSLAACF
jgi:hypothetical protein